MYFILTPFCSSRAQRGKRVLHFHFGYDLNASQSCLHREILLSLGFLDFRVCFGFFFLFHFEKYFFFVCVSARSHHICSSSKMLRLIWNWQTFTGNLSIILIGFQATITVLCAAYNKKKIIQLERREEKKMSLGLWQMDIYSKYTLGSLILPTNQDKLSVNTGSVYIKDAKYFVNGCCNGDVMRLT